MLDIVDQGFSVYVVECVGCVDEDDRVGSFVVIHPSHGVDCTFTPKTSSAHLPARLSTYNAFRECSHYNFHHDSSEDFSNTYRSKARVLVERYKT